jgi:hypothetical protein
MVTLFAQKLKMAEKIKMAEKWRNSSNIIVAFKRLEDGYKIFCLLNFHYFGISDRQRRVSPAS